jgi:hypothetical protein
MKSFIVPLALLLGSPVAASPAEPSATPHLAPAIDQWRKARASLGPLLMKEVNLELGRIKREFGDEIARIYFAEQPELHAVVLLKRKAPVADRIVRIGGRLRIRMVEDQDAVTQREVETRLHRRQAEIARLLPELQGYAVDTAAGEVEMHVYAVGEEARRVAARAGEVERLIDYRVRIVPVAGRVSIQDG